MLQILQKLDPPMQDTVIRKHNNQRLAAVKSNNLRRLSLDDLKEQLDGNETEEEVKPVGERRRSSSATASPIAVKVCKSVCARQSVSLLFSIRPAPKLLCFSGYE